MNQLVVNQVVTDFSNCKIIRLDPKVKTYCLETNKKLNKYHLTLFDKSKVIFFHECSNTYKLYIKYLESQNNPIPTDPNNESV